MQNDFLDTDPQARKKGLIDALSPAKVAGGLPPISSLGTMPQDQLDAFNKQAEAGGAITRARAPVDMRTESQGWNGSPMPSIAAGEDSPNAGGAPALDQPLPSAAPDYTKVGKYASNAYDPAKFTQPWDQRSEKYQIGTILSNFDPKQGLTPDVIDALNKANIHGAKFSGSGDKLNVDNAGGYDRFGTGGTADVVTGLKGGNGTWGAWHMDDPNAGQPQQGGGGLFAGSSINPMLQGDASSNIQQALQNIGGMADSDKLQQLIAQLGGR